jgi:hypothetical protein
MFKKERQAFFLIGFNGPSTYGYAPVPPSVGISAA